MIGITDVTFIAGGGAKAVDLGEETMERFVEKLGADIERASTKPPGMVVTRSLPANAYLTFRSWFPTKAQQ